jgi:hypothetical protein
MRHGERRGGKAVAGKAAAESATSLQGRRSLASNDLQKPRDEAAAPTGADARPSPVPTAPERDEFSLKKAVFEIAIVAVGVLLALAVDEARQGAADRALAEQSRAALQSEIDQNRIRLASKLALLHRAYVALEADPGAGPRLVEQRSNFQMVLADAAWRMAAETGALRLLEDQERQKLAYIYSSLGIYNDLIAEEMKQWTALAASTPDDASVRLWKAYAHRMASSACITTVRIERFRNPALPSRRVQPACERYRLSLPPQQLFRALGVTMPDTGWRPGGEF